MRNKRPTELHHGARVRLGALPTSRDQRQEGTILSFDDEKLPTYLWEEHGTRDDRIAAYSEWFDRYSELPPVVE